MRRQRNVFDQIGFSPEESAALTMKSELYSKIMRRAEHYSQKQLQEILGEPQPRISDLLRGKMAKFSLDALVRYAAALDMRPEIKVHQPVVAMSASAH